MAGFEKYKDSRNIKDTRNKIIIYIGWIVSHTPSKDSKGRLSITYEDFVKTVDSEKSLFVSD